MLHSVVQKIDVRLNFRNTFLNKINILKTIVVKQHLILKQEVKNY